MTTTRRLKIKLTDEQVARISEIVDDVKLDERAQDSNVYVDAIIAAIQDETGDFERIELLDEGKTLNIKLTSEGIIADRVDAKGNVESSWALTYGELDERLY